MPDSSKRDIKIETDPRKRLFIELLTRDISLIDCILDLIDNSVDSAVQLAKFKASAGLSKKPTKRLAKFLVSVNLSPQEFSIVDNAKGIDEITVKEEVFRFGATNKKRNTSGLSVYGIGMKRALFKIGREIKFESKTKEERTTVNMDVDEWMGDEENWAIKGSTQKNTGKSTGTNIVVRKINPDIARNFSSPAFQRLLIDKIAMTHGVFLHNGLRIEVNGTSVKSHMPTIASSKRVGISSKVFTKGEVKIRIIAGLSSNDERASDGWYVFCNGRMILEGDKSYQTGWGTNDLRKFHASTGKFIGFVYFESNDVSLLPWTTTKNAVDYDSEIYQYALGHMITIAKPIVRYLVKQFYKQKKDKKGVEAALDGAKEVSVATVGPSSLFSVKLPKNIKGNKEEIAYEVATKDISKVRKFEEDEDMPNEEIGRRTFYYFLNHQE
ncbi:MAG: ATP-binding protein [Candidatus Pacebacteria bacterium]|nr:ATP-binding protein [Candidatus Paceibacterota bacterium]